MGVKGKILVLAEDGDSSIDDVLTWLKYQYDTDIVRINDKDKIEILDILITNDSASFSIRINDNTGINSNDIKSYWYRRGRLSYQGIYVSEKVESSEFTTSVLNGINEYYSEEWTDAVNTIHFMLQNSNIKNIGSFFDVETNKIKNLEIARKVGLEIPKSLVSNSVDSIIAFISSQEKTIVKPVRSTGSAKKIGFETFSFSQKTSIFDKSTLEKVLRKHSKFQPTHFQEYIEKDFEIRAFYIEGKIYAMAIFSQSNEQTKIDFRDYDRLNPNRNVPFRLPNAIEDKLISLMSELRYKTGSFDIIYSKGRYVFLEVNTLGQFEWVSKSCNYFIEKKIANQIEN